MIFKDEALNRMAAEVAQSEAQIKKLRDQIKCAEREIEACDQQLKGMRDRARDLRTAFFEACNEAIKPRGPETRVTVKLEHGQMTVVGVALPKELL